MREKDEDDNGTAGFRLKTPSAMNLTARMIAYCRACESKYPREEQLFSDPYAEAFLTKEAIDFTNEMIAAIPSLQKFIRLRTRYIDDCLREFSTSETQIVIIGAGADTRAFRLTLPAKSFYELDLPGSADEKIAILKEHHCIDHGHINYLGIDLSKDSLYDVMAASNFSGKKHAIFVLEGVVMYLPHDANSKLLGDIDALMKTEYHIIYYYNTPAVISRSTGEIQLTNHANALAAHGYPFHFGVDDLDKYVSTFNMTVVKNLSVADIQELYAPNMDFPKGCGKHYHVAVLKGGDSVQRKQATGKPRTYIYDNDGHFGAFISFIILWNEVGKKLVGVSLTKGDGLIDIAAQSYKKLFHMMGAETNLAVGNGEVTNPFPNEWQKMSSEFDAIIGGKHKGKVKTVPKHFAGLVVDAIKKMPSGEKITIIATGPLTSVADYLKTHGTSGIAEIVIMGGAINVPGNVAKSERSDGSAEWNFFANPLAAKTVLSSGIPVTLVPLDVTNAVPVTPEFIKRVGSVKGEITGLTVSLLQYAHSKYPNAYYLWEPLAVLAALEPSAVEVEAKQLDVITTGLSQGRVVAIGMGHPCNVVTRIDRGKILELFFKALSVKK